MKRLRQAAYYVLFGLFLPYAVVVGVLQALVGYLNDLLVLIDKGLDKIYTKY